MPFEPDEMLITDDVNMIIDELSNPDYHFALKHIFRILRRNTNLIPQLGFKDTPKIIDYLKKWIDSYSSGYLNRPSQRSGQQSSTFPDQVLKYIYKLRFKVSDDVIDIISKGHASMMTLENIIGDLLEEYIECELKEERWLCCWGKSVRHVDFCHEDGTLLQIKNSDNSENSSSRSVRGGTEIVKWARRKARKSDEYNWPSLNEITGNKSLSEDGFRSYIDLVIQQNRNCIYFKDEESG